MPMAEYNQHQHHQQQQQTFGGIKAPSTSQLITVVTLLPIGGALLLLSGLTFIGSVIGLVVAAPLFLIFSPVLVPAALVIAGAVVGFLTSGAFGVTALSSFSWIVSYLRSMQGCSSLTEQAKRRLADTAGYVNPKTKEAAQTTAHKTQEGART